MTTKTDNKESKASDLDADLAAYTPDIIKTMSLVDKLSAIMEIVGPIKKTKRADDTVTFKYRSIDEVQNRLNPILAHFRVTLQSKIIKLKLTMREFDKEYNNKITKKIVYTAVLQMQYIFSDGTAQEIWEEAAMSEDYADKAVSQASSMCYKYMLLRKLCIPTEDVTDPDSRQPDYRDTSHDEERSGPKPTKWLNENTEEWEQVEQGLLDGTMTFRDVDSKWKVNKTQKTTLLALEEKGKKNPAAPKQEPVKNEEKKQEPAAKPAAPAAGKEKVSLTAATKAAYDKAIADKVTFTKDMPIDLRAYNNNVTALVTGKASYKVVSETYILDAEVDKHYQSIAKRQE